VNVGRGRGIQGLRPNATGAGPLVVDPLVGRGVFSWSFGLGRSRNGVGEPRFGTGGDLAGRDGGTVRYFGGRTFTFGARQDPGVTFSEETGETPPAPHSWVGGERGLSAGRLDPGA